MNALGQLVAFLLSLGLVFLVVAVLRARIDGAAAASATLILLALAVTVWAAINRKRHHT